jgi:hypothetical protein
MPGRGGSRLYLCIEWVSMGILRLDMGPFAWGHVDLSVGGTNWLEIPCVQSTSHLPSKI